MPLSESVSDSAHPHAPCDGLPPNGSEARRHLVWHESGKRPFKNTLRRRVADGEQRKSFSPGSHALFRYATRLAMGCARLGEARSLAPEAVDERQADNFIDKKIDVKI